MDTKTVITDKLYQRDPFAHECDAVVTAVYPDAVVTDRTVAFAEAGGQESDFGNFFFKDNNTEIPFHAVRKGPGRVLLIPDFPSIPVETPVFHQVTPEATKQFKPGMTVRIRIDTTRRLGLMANHTGIHLVLMALDALNPDSSGSVNGAHIKVDSARLDFHLGRKFSPEDIDFVRKYVAELIESNEPIVIFHHPEEPEAWFWQCRDIVYPCGGSHFPSAGYVNCRQIKRKGLGKKKERIIGQFSTDDKHVEFFHEHS